MPGRRVRIYECAITGVSPVDRTIDAHSRNGTTFKQVSYLMPYANLMGSGLDVVPRSGDKCLILATDVNDQPSMAYRGRLAYCIGFEVPVRQGAAGLRLGGRDPDFTEGTVALRAVGEDGTDARVVCHAGGTVVIGSGKAARTVYSPINNTIASLFDNLELHSSGGTVKWLREPGTDDVSFEAELRTKAVGDTSAVRLRVKVGVEEDPVVIESSPDPGAEASSAPFFRIAVTEGGEVNITGNVLNFSAAAAIDIDAPTVTIKGKPVLGEKDPI